MCIVEFGTVNDEHILIYNFDAYKTEDEVCELNKKCDQIFMSALLESKYDGEPISTGREHTVRFRNIPLGVALAAAQDIAYLLKANLDLF